MPPRPDLRGRKRRRASLLVVVTLFGASARAVEGAGQAEGGYRLEPVLPGLVFDRPLRMLVSPAEPARWFVVEQGGTVRTFVPGNRGAVEQAVDLRDRVWAGGEAGLLGMAFHPRFSENGEVFLSYTAPGGVGAALVSRVSRFHSPDRRTVDPDSEVVLLSLDQPYPNHNGGNIEFGPDGYLYIGFGDGGAAGDPGDHAQNRNTLLGAMLRIDVDGTDPERGLPYAIPPDNPFASSPRCGDRGCPEIHAWGLRNPWRWSFDRETGRLWAGDVGQNEFEEIDIVERGGNYGWRCYEGNEEYDPRACGSRNDHRFPVAVYDHGEGCAVTGGYVYRGAGLPDLRGRYLYGDFCSGRVWSLDAENPEAGPELLFAQGGLRLASFAEDAVGELYLISLGGTIFRLKK